MKLKDGDIIREQTTGRMFVMSHNKRRWILTIEAAQQFGLLLDQYMECSEEEIRNIPIGGPIVDYPDQLKDCKNCTSARAFLAKDLGESVGIECGPGSAANCYPLPLEADVRYLDRFNEKEGCNQDYDGDFPYIDYKTTINKMDGIYDNSLDFIVHCHVIEHSRNPLEALDLSYKKLKSGGRLIMAVPDKRYTFDKPRKLTKAKHLLKDYREGVTDEKDLEHVHCCNKIWVGSEYKMVPDLTDNQILEYLKKDLIDIHWHTYTDRSFKKLLKVTKKLIPWKKMDVFPICDFVNKEQFIEFYVVLQK